MDCINDTYKQLLDAALDMFIAQGIKKTTVDDIAVRAGLTRNTAYRYFRNKKNLVRAAFIEVLEVFKQVEQSLSRGEINEIEAALDAIQEGMAHLPRGNFLSLLGQLKHFDPKIHAEIQTARIAVVKQIFDHLSQIGEQQGILREGLNRDIVQAYFMELVVNLISSPQLAALNLNQDDVYVNIKSIFLRGILK